MEIGANESVQTDSGHAKTVDTVKTVVPVVTGSDPNALDKPRSGSAMAVVGLLTSGLDVLAEGAMKVELSSQTNNAAPAKTFQHDGAATSKKRKLHSLTEAICVLEHSGLEPMPSSKVGRSEVEVLKESQANNTSSGSKWTADSGKVPVASPACAGPAAASGFSPATEADRVNSAEHCMLQNLRAKQEAHRLLLQKLRFQSEPSFYSSTLGMNGTAPALDDMLYHQMLPRSGFPLARGWTTAASVGGAFPLHGGLPSSASTQCSRLALQYLNGMTKPTVAALEFAPQPQLSAFPFASTVSTITTHYHHHAHPPVIAAPPSRRIFIAPEPATSYKQDQHQDTDASRREQDKKEDKHSGEDVEQDEKKVKNPFNLPSRWMLDASSPTALSTSNDCNSNVQVLGKLYALPPKWYDKESIVALLDQKKAFLVPNNKNGSKGTDSSASFLLYVPAKS